MKTVKNIISQLKGEPFLRHLGHYKCYERYIRMLPARFRTAVSFVYVKNKVLHIALAHPGYKMEMELNKNTLLELLKILTSDQSECQSMTADRIVLFNSKYAAGRQTEDDTDTVPRYHELASGDFETPKENRKLSEQFEKLKQNIRKNLQK